MPSLLLDPVRVKPFAGQPRRRFRGIPALAESIRAVGQVTPIVVTQIANPNGDGYTHELVDGERRLRACLSLPKKIKAVLEDEAGAKSRFALSIAANFCRQEHDCIEISEAIWTLKADGRTREEIAAIFGKSVQWVAMHQSLAGLAPEIRHMLTKAGDENKQAKRELRKRGRMTLSLALLLVPLEHKWQLQALRKITRDKLSLGAARNYIHRMTAGGVKKSMVKPGSRLGKERSPAEQWTTLENAVETFRHAIDRYATAPQAKLQAIMAAGGPAKRSVLSIQLEKLCEDLLRLADDFAKEKR